MTKAAWFLLVVGLVQLAGEGLIALGLPTVGQPVKAIGAATTASPAPKVFTSVRGLETFSTRFTLEWEGKDGQTHSLLLTPELYGRVRGPYNRRNVYGAVLAYGPVLLTDERTKPLFESVIRFAMTGDAPLLRELGVDPDRVGGTVRIRYEPREGMPPGDWPRVIEVGRE